MTILLVDRGDECKVIEQEKNKWVAKNLVALGINEAAQKSDNSNEYLASLGVEVWQNTKGEVDISRNKKIVAQWKEPQIVLIKENGGLYYKVSLNEWSLLFPVK